MGPTSGTPACVLSPEDAKRGIKKTKCTKLCMDCALPLTGKAKAIDPYARECSKLIYPSPRKHAP